MNLNFKNLIKNKNLRNISWLTASGVITQLATFISTLLISRHFGPATFGRLAFATSFIAIFNVLAQFGLSGIAVREFVTAKNNPNAVFGNILLFRVICTLFALISISIILSLLKTYTFIDEGQYVLIGIVGLSIVASPLEIFLYWHESVINGKIISITNISISLAGTFAIIFILANNLSVKYAALVFSLKIILQLTILSIIASRLIKFKIKIDGQKVKQYFQNCSIIFLGAIFAVIYFRVDEIMLKFMTNDTILGPYALSAKIITASYIVPISICNTFYPKIISLKSDKNSNYSVEIKKILKLLWIAGICNLIIIILGVNLIIKPILGEPFADCYVITPILSLAMPFFYMRFLFSKWLQIEHLYKYSLITQVWGGVFNVMLNLLLIPSLMGIGAAIATLLSYAVASYASLAFYAKTRPFFLMMSSTIRRSFG